MLAPQFCGLFYGAICMNQLLYFTFDFRSLRFFPVLPSSRGITKIEINCNHDRLGKTLADNDDGLQVATIFP